MEASARMDCDLENEEEEDLEFFQKTIKVHDRFGGNCDEEDEFYSDDEPDEPISCPKGGHLKPTDAFSRTVLSAESNMETISMLDSVRSSCCKSGRNLSLEMLNLKSDEVGLGTTLKDVFLGKSILGSSPPFGDPLSEMDILDSALSLLDDRTCKKFREEGLFDGLVDMNALSIENDMKAKEKDVGRAEAKLDLVTCDDNSQTPESYFNICDSPDNLGKASCKLIHEDVSKQDLRPSTKSEPLDPLLSCQIKKSRQSKSASSSRKQLNDSDSLDSKGSVSREFPPNNLSLDDLVRYINGESLKKVCSRKASTPSDILPQTIALKTRKSKKQPVKKLDIATAPKARVPPASNRLRKATKKPSHEGTYGTEDFEDESSSQEVFFDVDVIPTTSGVATLTASAKEATSASDAEHEEKNAGDEEFTAVLHRRRVKTRKEPNLTQETRSSCGVSLRTKTVGHQPDKASANIDKDLVVSTALVFSVSCKLYRSDTSGGSMTSKRGSLSSLDESPPLATYETSTLGTSTRIQGHVEVPCSRPTFSKFSAGNSYASALLQNMPKVSVTGSRQVSQAERGAVESVAFTSPLNSEAESEMLLSPPQSEADTGFSSSSSLSPDEGHNSLACDSAVVVDSEPSCLPLEESSVSMQVADVLPENLERPFAECVVQDTVSCHISNLDFPLTRISELSVRTDKVQQQNTGEIRLTCSSSVLSCATTPSKTAPVIFDRRIRAVAHEMSDSDIVFLFDAEDSGSDAASNVGNYVPVDDIDGITFTSSPDSMPFETGASEQAGVNCTVLDVEASFAMKTNREVEKADLENQRGILVVDDQTGCDELIPQRDSEYENPVSNRTSAESSVSEAVCSTPHGSFDLLTAQKFLSQAFRSVLKREHECPGQVVRL